MQERLSVLQIVSTPSLVSGRPAGITGPERRAANLAPQWKEHGIDVTVLYPRRGALWESFADSGVTLVDYELRGKWNLRSVERVCSEIRQRRPSVIHTQGGPAVDLAAVYSARVSRIASVVTRPVMIEDQVERSPYALFLFNKIDRYYTLARSDAIVAVSRNGFERLKERAAGRKVHLVHNGVKPVSMASERGQARGDASCQVHVGMIGHLLSYKGWDDFLRVAREVTVDGLNIRFHVVGEGPEHPKLEALARELGIADRVVFHGLLHDVSPVLRLLDIFLFTSHREGLSVAVLEAMSTGLPIVATDVAGIGDQVKVGVNGFILPVNDVKGLAEKCRRLVKNPVERLTMGQNSRMLMQRHFSEKSMLSGYVNIYRSVAKNY